jgi:hypothetical protein
MVFLFSFCPYNISKAQRRGSDISFFWIIFLFSALTISAK